MGNMQGVTAPIGDTCKQQDREGAGFERLWAQRSRQHASCFAPDLLLQVFREAKEGEEGMPAFSVKVGHLPATPACLLI